MKKTVFTGAATAIITPMKDGGIDYESFARLINWQIDEGIIRRQYPEEGTVVEKNSARILAYTDKETETATVKVPDVTGMSAVAANQVLINAGLNIRILGTKNYLSGTEATVISQSVAAGEIVPIGTVVEVTFRHLDDKDFDEAWNPDLLN